MEMVGGAVDDGVALVAALFTISYRPPVLVDAGGVLICWSLDRFVVVKYFWLNHQYHCHLSK
jgi:hypothetical protein